MIIKGSHGRFAPVGAIVKVSIKPSPVADLADGSQMPFELGEERWRSPLLESLRKAGFIRLVATNGKVVWVNPHHVVCGAEIPGTGTTVVTLTQGAIKLEGDELNRLMDAIAAL